VVAGRVERYNFSDVATLCVLRETRHAGFELQEDRDSLDFTGAKRTMRH